MENRKKEKKFLGIFYPFARWIIGKSRRKGVELCSEQNARTLRNEGLVGSEMGVLEYTMEKIALSLAVFSGALLLALAYMVSNKGLAEDKYLTRPGYGMEPEMVEMDIDGNTERFEILPRIYDMETVKENFKSAYKEILEIMKADNECLESVTTSLKLPTYLEEYAIGISWSSSKNELVNGEGTVSNYYFETEQREWVTLTATFSCQEYSCVYDIDVCVQAPVLDDGSAHSRKVAAQIEKMNQEDRLNSRILLPQEVEGREISYRIKREKLEWVFLLGGLIGSLAVFFGKDADLRNLDKKRNNQMMLDYPEIVSKLTILLGAGMSVRLAWEKIVEDYRKKGVRRYAYEEMVITCNEIRAGTLESIAYSRFGKRCNIHEYLKFGAILEQNVKSGTKGLAAMLENEAWLAFEVRKNTAVKMGEEAGTKLLLPMIMMLAVVLVIVMIPALMSLGI